LHCYRAITLQSKPVIECPTPLDPFLGSKGVCLRFVAELLVLRLYFCIDNCARNSTGFVFASDPDIALCEMRFKQRVPALGH
jgi:hypothetical protein